ncbi:MAG: hypothetical protein SGI87_04805 [Flavobacteriales bacterium]|nr:hypothetical protein [Flavobacteriales bacterium]
MIKPVVLFLLLTFAFFSCNSIKNKEQKIIEINDRILALDSAQRIFSDLNTAQLQSITDSVEAHLEYVQRTYLGEMEKHLAEPLAKYRTILKLLPDIGKRSDKVKIEIDRTRKQLDGLKTALEMDATKDAVGNKIDNGYVEKAMKEEMDVAGNLVGEIRQISEKALLLNERYQMHYPIVKDIVDSLRLNSKIPLKKKI